MGILLGVVVSGVTLWGFRSKVGGGRGGVSLHANGGGAAGAGAVKVNLAPGGGEGVRMAAYVAGWMLSRTRLLVEFFRRCVVLHMFLRRVLLVLFSRMGENGIDAGTGGGRGELMSTVCCRLV